MGVLPFVRLLLAALSLAALAACHRAPPPGPDALTVEASPVPQAEILREAARLLAPAGVTLRIVPVADYGRLNDDVAAGRADLNYFETAPFLAAWNAAHGNRLVTLAAIHVEPMGGYSRRWKSLARLPEHVTIAIPDDPANGTRALRLLAQAGIVRLREPRAATIVPDGAEPNRRLIRWRRAPAGALPGLLGEVDLALINTDVALGAKLDPVRDALLIEGRNSPYVNFLVGPPQARHDPRVAKLAAALRSPAARRFMERRYRGAVVPAR